MPVHKRMTLADTIKSGKSLPTRLVFHAPGGVGKTCLGAAAPAPYFMLSRGETGLETLIDQGILPEIPHVEISDWESTLGIIDELRTSNHDRKTLVMDVINGFAKIAGEHALWTKFEGDPGPAGYMNFSAGDRYVAQTPWRELLAALDRLREEKKMMIILLAHTKKITFQNPTGADYDRFEPDMYKDIWQVTDAWADMVLFGHHETFVRKATEKATKGKASGGQERLMQTTRTAAWDAKNRHGMTGAISMGAGGREAWRNLVYTIKTAREANIQARLAPPVPENLPAPEQPETQEPSGDEQPQE